ncbi:MAG: hypothetical protein R2759_15555 [Bacteroidales bacterium]
MKKAEAQTREAQIEAAPKEYEVIDICKNSAIAEGSTVYKVILNARN